MPTTRKKVIKTVYKDDNESDSGAGDFSDSGSDAKISEHPSSEDEEDSASEVSSSQEFTDKSRKKTNSKPRPKPKKKFAKELYKKLDKQSLIAEYDQEVTPPPFSVKDLTEENKLLPTFLNLSESDSSDDESPNSKTKPQLTHASTKSQRSNSDTEDEPKIEYKDVWANNTTVNSEDVAKQTFQELEEHKSKIEEAKALVMKYKFKAGNNEELNVTDLLAQGEELPMEFQESKIRDDSDSEMEDWEEVKEAKGIPKQGLQLVLNIPNEAVRKTKKLDVEMMMKRKINRVKKEHQVFMHKVHILCWLGHGNYVSRVLNDQEVLAAALSLVPSKECYPGERVDMKYLEQITAWYKDKLTLKQDKNEDKFKPKAPHLKEILLEQIKKRVVTAKKYFVFIFVSMLRALGLQCRVMFNFVALPLKPPSSELCSLSTKQRENKDNSSKKKNNDSQSKEKTAKNKDLANKTKTQKLAQVDGNFDNCYTTDSSDSQSDFENICQLDGNDVEVKTKSSNKRKTRNTKLSTKNVEDVSPPKQARKSPSPKPKTLSSENQPTTVNVNPDYKSEQLSKQTKNKKPPSKVKEHSSKENLNEVIPPKRKKIVNDEDTSQKFPQETSRQSRIRNAKKTAQNAKDSKKLETSILPKIIVSKAEDSTESKYFNSIETNPKRTRSQNAKTEKQSENFNNDTPKRLITKSDDSNKSKYFTAKDGNPKRTRSKDTNPVTVPEMKTKTRTKSSPNCSDKSKYFENSDKKFDFSEDKKPLKRSSRQTQKDETLEDQKRVSHRDLISKTKEKKKGDITEDLVKIIKSRVKEAKESAKKLLVKGKVKEEPDDDSDFLPEEDPKKGNSDSDDDFNPPKISPKPPKVTPGTSRKKDRRVLSSDDETPKNKTDVWCEVFVEELEQWIAVDVIKGKVHCTSEIYNQATHPVCYVVGWDNNNYLKDLTRRYVPHWNTVTRKQRAEPSWWDTAIRPWLGPKNAKDREEDEQLNRMQLEAPLPKSIAEYKNHPLYALKRHLLKFEAIYPPDAATLGFVRNEPVYSRDCVYVCRSRDTWLKEAKVVRLGEQPYKVVKARPKWDKLSNKLITDKPLEVFGPWQVQDYEPPVAENGIVPRNAYGNVELFKDCMLPKGTAHIKLPGLNRIAKKLNIDCAPAMTGFEFNGGWSHPVYDGFVVCKEYETIITEAWLKDQEEQERKEQEKLEARVYGNWKRLIKGLLIKERLKNRYGFKEPEPSTSHNAKKSKGPRLVVKKKN